MTEAEWDSTTKIADLLHPLLPGGKVVGGRKLRLYVANCCQLLRLYFDPKDVKKNIIKALVDHVEEGVDNLKKLHQPVASYAYSGAVYDRDPGRVLFLATEPLSVHTVIEITRKTCWSVASAVCPVDTFDSANRGYLEKEWSDYCSGLLLERVGVIKDIFGNPFRTMNFDSSWLTPSVQSLAQAAYEHQDPSNRELDPLRLAVLADALEDTGCDNPHILSHCRGPNNHVRGCWVLDRLLGKW